jgi:transposase
MRWLYSAMRWLTDSMAASNGSRAEVIVANARKVRLIGESRKKDDRLDAQTLARLARIDPQLLYPVKHRSVQAQADLMMIRARAGLVRVRTGLVNTLLQLDLACFIHHTVPTAAISQVQSNGQFLL